jgi:glycosidase
MAKLYYTLTQDHYYSNPYKNLIFLDNHDVSRMATTYNKDMKKQKMALNLLATLRGTPQLFYGAEIMMEGGGNNHGILRGDFPGGWEGDKINGFTQQGLNTEQIELQNYTKKLFNWRKTCKPLHEGKFMHFVPEGVYVYFRYTDNESVMVINNNHNKDERKVITTRFAERLKGFTSAYNPLTGETIENLSVITVPAKTSLILELKK